MELLVFLGGSVTRRPLLTCVSELKPQRTSIRSCHRLEQNLNDPTSKTCAHPFYPTPPPFFSKVHQFSFTLHVTVRSPPPNQGRTKSYHQDDKTMACCLIHDSSHLLPSNRVSEARERNMKTDIFSGDVEHLNLARFFFSFFLADVFL